MKRFSIRDLGISTKFVLSLLVFLIAPLMLLFGFFNARFSTELEQRSSQTVLETLKQARTPLSAMVNDVNFVSKEILANESVQEYLSQCAKADAQELYTYRYSVDLFVERLLDSRDYIQHVALFNVDGERVAQGGTFLEQDQLPEEDMISQLAPLPLYWSSTQYNEEYLSKKARGYECISLRVINDFNQLTTPIGAEKIAIREEYVCGLYASTATDATENMLLVTSDGIVVSSMDKSLINTSVAQLAAFDEITSCGAGYLLGEDTLTTWCKLDEVDWYLIRIDRKEPIVNISFYRTSFYIFLSMILIFSVVFFFIQRHTIIHPIKDLSDEVRQFHEGNYTLTERDRNDEIGMLNHSIAEMGHNIENLIEKVYKAQLSEKDAQLKYLQAQINPHFLNNTLESIRWMAIQNKQPDIAKQVQALARLFKHALNSGKETTTVQEEVTYLQDYVTIQKNRFGDRIRFQFAVDEAMHDCQVLNLILQPLVENAIVHGLEEKLSDGLVDIRVLGQGEDLLYIVEDNGLGADPTPIQAALQQNETSENAYALTNIHQRLVIRYGARYGITFESTLGNGTRVTVRMPQCREEQQL